MFKMHLIFSAHQSAALHTEIRMKVEAYTPIKSAHTITIKTEDGKIRFNSVVRNQCIVLTRSAENKF